MSLNVVMNNQMPLQSAQHVRSAAQANYISPYQYNTGSHAVLQGGNYVNSSNAYIQRGLASAGNYRNEASVPYVIGSPQRYEGRNIQALAVQPFYVEPQQQIQRVVYQQPSQIVAPQPVVLDSSIAVQQGGGFWQSECERLQILIRERTDECEAWKSKSKHLEAHLAGLQVGDTNQTRELETQIQFSASEITRLNAVVSDLSAECELWRRKCMELDGLRTLLHDKNRLEHDNGQLTAIIEDLNMKLQGLDEERLRADYMKRAHFQEKDFYETEIRKLQTIIESKNAELAEWGARYTQIEIRAGASKDLEAKIVILGSEVERLHAILRTNLEEMERYQVTIQQMERSLADLRGWQVKYSESENEILRLREQLEQWISKYSRLEHSMADYKGSESRLQTLAMEIEKLNSTLIYKQQEIDELNARLRMSEANASYKSEIQRLQVLLEERNRELEDWRIKYSRQESLIVSLRSQESSIREYENNLALLSQEVERLNTMLRRKEEEIERLNYGSSETYRLKEMLDSRNRTIAEWEEKYSRLEISIRELRSKETALYDLENANSILRKEVERLKIIVSERENECYSLRSQMEKLEISIRDYRSYEGRVSQYEEKIAILSQEIERLNSMINTYRGEIESWKSKYSQLEYSRTDTYEVKIREYTSKITEYENKFAMLSQEIERLRSMHSSKDSEIESLRYKLSQQESYSYEISNYKKTINGYEDKIALLSQEIERLNSIIKTYASDIESWKSRYSSLEVRISDTGRYEQEAMYLRERLTEYENKIALLSQEIERLNGILRSKSMESEQWSTKYKDVDMKMAMLTQEIERLRSVIASKDSEVEEWRIRFSKSETSIRELSLQQGRFTEYENKIALLSQEIERLNRILQSKSAEVDEWRVKYSRVETSTREITILQSKLSDYEGRIAMLSQEIERLNSIISSKNSEIDEWRVKISRVESSTTSFQVQVRDFENKIALLSQEIERLNSILSSKNAEIDEWRVRYSKVESSSREITIMQTTIREYEDKVAMLSQEISRLNSMLQNKNKEIEEWRYKYSSIESSTSSTQYRITEYESKIALLTQEIERINSLLKSRMVELEEWKSKYATMESRSRESVYTEDRIRSITAEMERYRRLYEESSAFQSRVEVLEANCQQYLMIMVLLFAELENLRTKYLEKEVEVESVITDTKQGYSTRQGYSATQEYQSGEGQSELAQKIRRLSFRPSNEEEAYVTKKVITKTYNTSSVSGSVGGASYGYTLK